MTSGHSDVTLKVSQAAELGPTTARTGHSPSESRFPHLTRGSARGPTKSRGRRGLPELS